MILRTKTLLVEKILKFSRQGSNRIGSPERDPIKDLASDLREISSSKLDDALHFFQRYGVGEATTALVREAQAKLNEAVHSLSSEPKHEYWNE